MKKYILGSILSLGLLVSPAFVPQAEAAGLSATQISAIIGLLQAFGADQSVIANVQIALGGGTPVGTSSVTNKLPPTGGLLTITTATPLPTATVGVPYAFAFTATGGTGALLWNLDPYNTRADIGGLEWSNADSSGRPNGLGVIRGTPTTAGTYRFTITVNNSVSKEFTLVVNPSSQTNTCTNWNYSNWGNCQSTNNGTQTRTVTGIPSGCTGGTPPPSTQSCSYTPPVVVSCTGTPPPTGNGVVVHGYTPVVTSPSGPSNTVWQYAAGSCGWSCTAPMLRNGEVGCKNPTAGSGVTVTVNNLFSTGQKVSGATVTAGTIFGLGSSFPALGSGGNPGTFTIGTNGITPEFWFQQGPTGSWTTIGVPMSGYKIKSAVGCTPQVFVNGGRQYNYCVNAVNGTPVTINLVPGDISTTPITVFPKSTFIAGESLTGTVVGGDPKNTWGCMDSPNTISGHECMSGWSSAWRQLTVPYGGQADGWHLVESIYGDVIELSPLPTAGYPAGTYTQYVKTGQYGTVKTPTSFTLTAAQNTTTYPLTVTINGTGIGGVHTADYTINCGMGGIYCSANAYSTTSITLIETPNAGSTFTGWSGACSGMGTTCTVPMSRAQVVTATFN